MTTPHERTRTIVQTRHFLKKLMANPSIPESIRGEANRLLRHFPDDGTLWDTASCCPELWEKPSDDNPWNIRRQTENS